ncbi:MAG: hypothetical protein ABSD68_02790 [Candidatus Micrarchaeales archaeon]
MTYEKPKILKEETDDSQQIKLLRRNDAELPKDYAIVKLTFDWSKLSKSEIAVVRELWKAIEPVDRVFRDQKAQGTKEITEPLEEIRGFAGKNLATRISSYLTLVKVNHSIYDAINSDTKLIPNFTADEIYSTIKQKAPEDRRYGLTKQFSLLEPKIFNKEVNPTRPLSGGFYIGDVPEKFFEKGDEGKKFREKVIMESPEEEREMIRKGLNSPTNIVFFKDGKPSEFMPYAEYFNEETRTIREALAKASQLSEDPTLKEYLLKRSKDVMTENCRESDIAWLNVRSKLNIVVGDVETYLDRGMGVRRDVEIVIYYTDEEKTKKVQGINALMSELEKRLPVTDEVKATDRKMAPTVVANTLYNAGEAHGAITAVAFSLPNDGEVIEKYGARTTMLYNAIAEKSRPRAVRIANALFDKSMVSAISEEDFIYGDFLNFLLHENSHPLGGLRKSLAGPETNTRKALAKALGGTYPTIEEAKADMVGLHHVPYLVEKGAITEREREIIYASTLVEKFVFMRAGPGAEAHIDAQIMEFNYLVEKGGIVRNASGTYRIDMKKFEKGVASLSEKLLGIEAEGNAEEGKKLLEKYVKLDPEERKAVAKLEGIPKIVLLEYPDFPQREKAIGDLGDFPHHTREFPHSRV